MKHLIILMLIICSQVQAATYYKDRPFPVPSGIPCMVDFGGRLVNGLMVESLVIKSTDFYVENPDKSWSAAKYKTQEFMTLTLTMANRTEYHIKDGNLELQKTAFLDRLSKCK